MGNTIVRSLVFALAVVGFSASSLYASSAKSHEAKVMTSKPGEVCSPMPVCMPGSACGVR